MKYFFDTEFIESAKGVELVSIGIVDQNGRMFYAESNQFDASLADDWVKENVLAKLKFWRSHARVDRKESDSDGNFEMIGQESDIRDSILNWLWGDLSPVFYAYFASYDWVVFTRLFGRLIDKPEHFPMWVVDLKQMMWERGLTVEWKQSVNPDPEGEHNALEDAIWNKELHLHILQFQPA